MDWKTPLPVGPVTIGGRTYRLEVEGATDGCKFWPCAAALSRLVMEWPLHGITVCELGCGLGLPGMVAAAFGSQVVFVDRDPVVGDNLLGNLLANRLAGVVRTDSWSNVSRRFDAVFGSELLYPPYGLGDIADFIQRCWTRKGRCLFLNGSHDHGEAFCAALEKRNLRGATSEFDGFQLVGVD